jgi:predicted ATPase
VAVEALSGRGRPATDTLLERDAELRAVAELLDAAGAGQGGLALVEGTPGVGKSALLDRVAEMGRARELYVLRARGHELERTFGWGVARSLFEAALASLSVSDRDQLLAGPAAAATRVLDTAGDGAAGSRGGFSILHGLYWVVMGLAEREPLLILVDDAHWADEPSLRFLVYLAGRVPEQPVAVLAGVRTGEAGEAGLVEHLAGDPAARIYPLASLGEAAVTELIRDRLPQAGDDLCRRCFHLTAGNPLQLRELLAAIEQQAQPADAAALQAAAELAARSLAHSVVRRLGALSPDAFA